MLKNKTSTLIMVWSSWCQACAQLITTVLEALPSASELKLKLMNFDINYRELLKLGIKHLPIMLLFQENKPMGMKIGSLTAQILSEWLISKLS